MSVDMQKIELLTPEEREYIYRQRQKEYRMEDARNHLIEYYDDDEEKVDELYDDGDFENLADEFIYEAEDCNRAENDVWAGLVADYVHERQESMNHGA